MTDNSLESVETEAPDVKAEEVKTEEVNEEVEAIEPSKTDEEVKEKPEEEKKEPTEAEKKAYALQKRIDRQTAANKTLQDELEAARKELMAIKPEQKNDDPKEEDFETFEDYQDALIEHRANKRLEQKEREAKQKQFQQKQQEFQNKMRKQFEERELSFKTENPDYETNAKNLSDLADDLKRSKGANNPTLNAIGQTLIEVDGAPALINHLGKNEDLVYELADMSPVSAAFKLFEMRQELLSTPKEEAQPKPQPVKALKGNGKPAKSLAERDGKGVLDWVNS